jgi:hypothetical protein
MKLDNQKLLERVKFQIICDRQLFWFDFEPSACSLGWLKRGLSPGGSSLSLSCIENRRDPGQ